MKINKMRLMLLYVAVSTLAFISCQKEEELLMENTGLPPAGVQQNQNADGDVCGAILYSDTAAQNRMAQMESIVQAYIAGNPDIASGSSRTIVTVPVVFHVLYNTAEQNISTAQIQSQVDVLNEDFTAANADAAYVPSAFQSLIGNANIHFVLAARDPSGNATTGITRTFTSVTSFSTNTPIYFTSMGGHDAWPASQYLNIWVCNKSGGAGYSSYPWSGSPSTDGVIIKYNYVGRVAPFINNWNYQKGRTVTHEVGHWLGLIHTWGDASCGSDLVGDTPQQTAANSSCPTFPHVSSCSPNSNGDMYMNYMDYTNDNCRNMFSLMQVARMLGYLNTTRASILTSLGDEPPTSFSCNAPGGLFVSSVTSSSALLNWASTGAVSYNLKYKPISSSIWTTVSTATTSYSVSGLTASTAYQFQVQSVCSSSSSAFSSLSNFATLAPASICNVPAGLTASSITATGATLSWASTGALSYIIRYKPALSSNWVMVSSTSTSKIVSGLTPSTGYQFQVQSICASGTSAYSSLTTFTTTGQSSACNVPTPFGVSSVASTSATLTWSSTGASSYYVRYRRVGYATWAIVSSSTTSRTVSWLSPGSAYEFQVRSMCSTSSSAYSTSSTFTTGY